jgi:ureidoglycolate dehydrogenase (NAD+)
MAAYGGITPIVGNLPLSYAIPAGKEPPIVLDMASGCAAHGKIGLARMAGESLPPNCFMTREGVDTQDPTLAAIVLPAAGPKGYGLALSMDILAGVLLGDIASCHKEGGAPSDATYGHFFYAIDIASFRDLQAFKDEVDRQIRTIRASKTRPYVERVYLPGEQSWLRRQDQLQNGIALPMEIADSLKKAGGELGVAAPWSQ